MTTDSNTDIEIKGDELKRYRYDMQLIDLAEGLGAMIKETKIAPGTKIEFTMRERIVEISLDYSGKVAVVKHHKRPWQP